MCDCKPSDKWQCPGCDEEICIECFHKFAHCYRCAKLSGVDAQLIEAASDAGFSMTE